MTKFKRKVFYCPKCGDISLFKMFSHKFCSKDGTKLKEIEIEYGE